MSDAPHKSRGLISRYEYDHWYAEDGHFYLKATALQYERVSETTFMAIVTRKMRDVLRGDGVLQSGQSLRATFGTEEWDRAHNIADGLLEALTYRTAAPVAHLRETAEAA